MIVGTGAAGESADEELVADVVVVGSLQPNQPGVLQVVERELEVVDDEDDEVLVAPPEVLSSRHPHQPGVLHVSVRVREYVLLELELLVFSVPLLSKNFQLKQS